MLQDVPGRKAVVLMTDGVDMNSTQTQQQVIEMAKASHMPIYTIGIGDPGKNEPVTTVLVLDHSGSMAAKAVGRTTGSRRSRRCTRRRRGSWS